MKPKVDNQKKLYSKLNERLTDYKNSTYLFLDNLAGDVASGLAILDIKDGLFRFSDYVQFNYTFNKIRNSFLLGLYALISSAVDKEWIRAEKSFLALLKRASDVYDENLTTGSDKFSSDSFKNRITGDMTLKQRISERFNDYKDLLETSISTSVQKGMNVNQIKAAINKDFNNLDLLRSSYKEKFGKEPSVKDVRYYVSRLAASEINMAYRESEQIRWRKLDFVLGYKICLSGVHKEKDICDELAGTYPKSFKWYGWHPLDRCYTLPVLMADTDFWDWNNGGKKKGEILDMPENFKSWVDNNCEKINTAKTPYLFIKDNWNGRLKEYANYKVDKQYKEVAFDYISGGIKAIHIGHILHTSRKSERFFNDLTSTQLELECQQQLFKSGRTAILRDESVKGKDGEYISQLDMELDKRVMDIRAITKDGFYSWALTAKNKQLYKFNKENDIKSDTVCLYFHEPKMFDKNRIEPSVKEFKEYINKHGFTQHIKHIIFVINGLDNILEYDI